MKAKKSRRNSSGGMVVEGGLAYYDEFGVLHVSLNHHRTTKTGQQKPNSPQANQKKSRQTPHTAPVRKITNHYSYCPLCKKTGPYNANHYRSYHQAEKIDDEHILCKECRQVYSPADFLAHACEVKRNQRISARSTAQQAKAIQEPAAPRRAAPQPPAQPAPAVEIVVCEHCGYRYPIDFPHTSVYHQNILTQEYHCPFCPALFSEGRSLFVHVKAAHPVRFISPKKNKNENPPNPRLVECKLCKQRLHPNEVIAHMTNHRPSSKQHPPRTQTASRGNQIPARPASRNGSFDDLVEPEFEQDGGRYLGYMSRENGRFGSLPEYDDYSDEADA